MKKAFLVILLTLLLNPRPFTASALGQDTAGAVSPRTDGWKSPASSDVPGPRDREGSPPENPVPHKAAPYANGEDDIFSNTYERELLSRRFFQKTLPPLNAREKIVWSFKTAQANLLL